MRDWLLIPTSGGLVRIATWYSRDSCMKWMWWRMLEKTRVVWRADHMDSRLRGNDGQSRGRAV